MAVRLNWTELNWTGFIRWFITLASSHLQLQSKKWYKMELLKEGWGKIIRKRKETVIWGWHIFFYGEENARVLSYRFPLLPLGKGVGMQRVHVTDYFFGVVIQSLSHIWLFGTSWTAAPRLSGPSLSPRICSNSCPLTWWCHPTISFSVAHFSCPQSLPASGSFPMSWLFASGGQSIGASASASVLPTNIQGRFSLGFTGSIWLLSKGLSRVFSSSTI